PCSKVSVRAKGDWFPFEGEYTKGGSHNEGTKAVFYRDPLVGEPDEPWYRLEYYDAGSAEVMTECGVWYLFVNCDDCRDTAVHISVADCANHPADINTPWVVSNPGCSGPTCPPPTPAKTPLTITCMDEEITDAVMAMQQQKYRSLRGLDSFSFDFSQSFDFSSSYDFSYVDNYGEEQNMPLGRSLRALDSFSF
ncbi:unnamed protein product, partial [Discosporangium mesarthrocarpum]